MDTIMQIFAIIGIIISILAVILFVAWAVSFYSSVAIKTFKYNLTEYCRVKNEHIEKKSQARRIRLAKAREQKIQHQNELQAIKLQTKQEIFEIKKRELEMKQQAKFEKAKTSAQERTGMSFDDIKHETSIKKQNKQKTKDEKHEDQDQDQENETKNSLIEQPVLIPTKDDVEYIDLESDLKNEESKDKNQKQEIIVIDENNLNEETEK